VKYNKLLLILLSFVLVFGMSACKKEDNKFKMNNSMKFKEAEKSMLNNSGGNIVDEIENESNKSITDEKESSNSNEQKETIKNPETFEHIQEKNDTEKETKEQETKEQITNNNEKKNNSDNKKPDSKDKKDNNNNSGKSDSDSKNKNGKGKGSGDGDGDGSGNGNGDGKLTFEDVGETLNIYVDIEDE